MIEQLELSRAYARRTDPETSHDAAKSVGGKTATELEAAVVAALRAFPVGLTTHELAAELELDYGSVTPRMRPLVRKGLVVDSGERRESQNRFNHRKCIVWRAA